MNGDNQIDLLIVYHENNNLSIILTSETEIIFDRYSFSSSIFVQDFNDDNRLNIVTLHKKEYLTILINQC